MRSTSTRLLALLCATFGLVAFTSCSFESSLGESQCPQAANGERDGGVVCRGGYWVNVEDADTGDAGADTETCLPESEVCNQVDDDCDRRVDEEIDCSCNFKGREKGVCGEARKNDGNCQRPADYNETEVRCGDGKDNDCDGEADGGDDDCQCEGSDTKPCYTGPDSTKGESGKPKGVCSSGIQNCKRGIWGACEDEVTPAGGEVCRDGKDNDCDGVVDGGCSCTYDPEEDRNIDTDASTNAGLCVRSTIEAAEGSDESVCAKPMNFDDTDQEGTKMSLCDGLDNDCDGTADEGCGCVYDPSEPSRVDTDQSHEAGICKQQSINAKGECSRPTGFETKTDREDGCSGVDNDCDGVVDEGCPCTYDPNEPMNDFDDSNASHNSGVCLGQRFDATGKCQAPSSGFESRTSGESSCNLDDNDCDGVVDEGCPCNYDPTEPNNNKVDSDGSHANGICVGKSRGPNGTCQKPNGFISGQRGGETQNNGCKNKTDDDCDGVVNDGCSCSYDPTEMKNIDTNSDHAKGICQNRTITDTGICSAPSGFERTQGDAESGSSCIDNMDNDCDGTADEMCPCVYDGSDTNNIDQGGDNANGVCLGQTLGSSGQTCQQPNGYDSTDDEGSVPNCDFKDNDCDGAIDEGCPCFYNGNSVGVCRNASRDSNGQCTDSGIDYSSTESAKCADGKDNDCDGTVDEPTKPAGKNCSDDCECYSGNCTGSGVCGHRIFVSSKTYDGALGGLKGADSKCQALASQLPGKKNNWKAILSDSSIKAKKRIKVRSSIHEIDSTDNKVADDKNDLWNPDIDDEINDTEQGMTLNTDSCGGSCDDDHVWSGTNADGTKNSLTCSDWTSNNTNNSGDQGRVGDAGVVDGDWIDQTDEDCGDKYRLYCIDGQY